MTSSPVTQRVFTPFEVIYWSLFCGIPTCLAIGGHLTKQDPPVPLVGWIILWVAVLGMWVIAGLFMARRWKWIHWLRYTLNPVGCVVGWAEDKYCVSVEAVEEQIVEVLAKMIPRYAGAEAALKGCVLFFQEPTWVQDLGPGFVARKVAGVQDGTLLYIGWRENLSESALKHELAHRVLQVCANDPDETTAHKLMAEMGIS